MSDLPAGWMCVRLGDYTSLHTGKRMQGGALTSGGILSLGGEHIGDDGNLRFLNRKYISKEFYEGLRQGKVQARDVLMVKDGATTGKMAFVREVSEPLAVNEHIFVIRSLEAERIDSHYVFFFLVSRNGQEQIRKRFHGLIGGIKREDVQGIVLPLPPICEQRAIATTLRAVQEAREARRRELVLERERKAALMEDLFTCGTRGEPCKQTEIGLIPQSWEVLTFEQVAEITKGQVNPATEPYKSMLHVGSENIEPGTGRLLPLKTNAELNIISGNYLFTDTDVLYSKIRPYLNKVALPSFTGTCSADMYPIRPRDGKLTREFLFHSLLTEAFKIRAMTFQDRTGIPKINRDQLNSIPLVKPPLDEQQDIAEVLTACDQKIAALEAEAALHDELFRALLEELMTGRLSTLPLLAAVE